MKQSEKRFSYAFLLALSLAVVGGVAVDVQAAKWRITAGGSKAVPADVADTTTAGREGAPSMALHHLHLSMMNHGLAMSVEGSGLVMLSEMGMAPDFDQTTDKHGRSMLDKGKDLIERAMSGKEMKSLHDKSDTRGSMDYTHSLGKAMLVVVDLLENMSSAAPESPDMTLHHMHRALNHALAMAAEGSNLIMLGQMGMSPTVDAFSIKHGKAMIGEAQTLWNNVIDGKAMKDMMGSEETPAMAETHELAQAGMQVIDLLAEMPGR